MSKYDDDGYDQAVELLKDKRVLALSIVITFGVLTLVVLSILFIFRYFGI